MADPTDADVDAEYADLTERATAGQVMGAIQQALRLGENEAVVDLLGILVRKDPAAADLIVRTIKYSARKDRAGG